MRSAHNVDTWRPRVYGVQLKMLQNCRLPLSAGEWAQVGEAVSSLGPYLQPESTPEALLQDLQHFAYNVSQWWSGRKREGSGNFKRTSTAAPPPLGALPPGKRLHTGDLTMPPLGPEALLHGVDSAMLPHLDAATALALARANQLPLMPSPPMTVLLDNDLDLDIQHVMSMNNLVDLPNGHGHPLPPPLPNSNGQNIIPTSGGGSGGDASGHQENNKKAWARKIVVLNVGGKQFSTTLATLASVEGSYFWKLAQKVKLSSTGDFFLDRNGDMFPYVLDYLRCQRYGEDFTSSGMPEDAKSLKLLKREAVFYRLAQLDAAIDQALAVLAQSL